MAVVSSVLLLLMLPLQDMMGMMATAMVVMTASVLKSDATDHELANNSNNDVFDRVRQHQ